jgi:membrane fusion protein (multidrug efflux system)
MSLLTDVITCLSPLKASIRGSSKPYLNIFCAVFLLLFSNISTGDVPTVLPDTLNSISDSTLLNNNNTPEYVVIQPSDIVTFSSETTASVAELNVREGSQFKKGDILLTLDCRIQQAELDKAVAQFSTAEIAFRGALKLKGFGSISELELIKAKSDAAIAKAEVEKLKTIVEKCTIKAPFNGAVSQLMVHSLETVKTGDPLLKIINTENLEFEIQIPSRWLKWLTIGSNFTVHINETNETVAATVTRIDPQIESISQTIKITGVVSQPNKSLLPGMSGQAIFKDNPEQPKPTVRK